MIDLIKSVDTKKGKEILVSKLLIYYKALRHHNALPTQKISISIYDSVGKLLATSRISNFDYKELKEYFEMDKGILSKYKLDYSEFTMYLDEKKQEIHFDLFANEKVSESMEELKRIIDLYESLDSTNMNLVKEVADLKAEIDRLHYIMRLDDRRFDDFNRSRIKDKKEIQSLEREVSSLKKKNRLLEQELEEKSRKNILSFLKNS